MNYQTEIPLLKRLCVRDSILLSQDRCFYGGTVHKTQLLPVWNP
jgi:hypothetical protein